MRLILSSRDFRGSDSRACILQNLPRPINECRVLFLPNEKATPEAIARGKYHSRLAEFGFSRDRITVFDRARPEEFFGQPIDVIYASGGNTFSLLHAVRSGGFDRELARRIRAGAVYIGGSAGAHLVSQSIEHLQAIDPNDAGVTDFRGLGLFRGVLVCHFSPERAALLERLRRESPWPVYALGDGDSLVADAEQIRLYGKSAQA